jgi:bifunctional non-homologous end joining protein LigD
MVWDVGTWEPLGDADAMLAKGDLKFRLDGQKLNGEFVLAHMRARRPGSKGNEWLLIKKKDDAMQPGFDVDSLDYSVLTNRTLAEIGGDKDAAEWESNRKAPVKKGAEWLFENKKAKPAAKVANSNAGSKSGAKTASVNTGATSKNKTRKAARKKSVSTKVKSIMGSKRAARKASAGKSNAKVRKTA